VRVGSFIKEVQDRKIEVTAAHSRLPGDGGFVADANADAACAGCVAHSCSAVQCCDRFAAEFSRATYAWRKREGGLHIVRTMRSTKMLHHITGFVTRLAECCCSCVGGWTAHGTCFGAERMHCEHHDQKHCSRGDDRDRYAGCRRNSDHPMRQAFYHAQSQKKQAEKSGVKAKKGSLSCVQIAMSLWWHAYKLSKRHRVLNLLHIRRKDS
jgi:hypothetical protein